MNNSEYLLWICSFAIAIVISEGIIMMFVGKISPLLGLFGSVNIWLVGHIWIFVTMWIFLMAVHFLGIHWYFDEKKEIR